MNKILVTLLALIGGSCISFAQMETGRVSDTAEDTLRIENEIVAVDTGFYQSVVRYDTVRYNLKMQSVYKKAFQLKNDVFVEKMKECDNYLIFRRAEDGAQTRDPQLGRLMLFCGCQKLRFRQQPTELLPFMIAIFRI